LIANSDRVEELKDLLLSLVPETHQENGCIQYDLLQNQDDPADFTFVEVWASRADLDAHLSSDRLQAAFPKLEGLVSQAPDIRVYRQIG
jgi:quinol monooxygenase YgiN